jgi:hypothetical protein
MNEGVKILIERMESNPEDFCSSDFEPHTGKITRGKYLWIADYLKKRLAGTAEPWYMEGALTPEEMEALMAAYTQFERKRFTERVMKDLLVDEEEKQHHGFIAQPVMTLGSNGNLGLGTTPGFNGTTLVANTGVQTKNAVTITPYHNGPSIDFNAQTITALNEMIGKWRGEDDGAI